MPTFWETQVTETQTLIVAVSQALLEFATDGAKQTVSLDTGQTRLSYSRSQIAELERTRERLLIQLLNLEKLTGIRTGTSHYARPAY